MILLTYLTENEIELLRHTPRCLTKRGKAEGSRSEIEFVAKSSFNWMLELPEEK